MATISIRIPEDLIADLKEMAPVLGFGGYQPLIRSYIAQGMRRDEARLAQPEILVTRETLEHCGVAAEEIDRIVSENLQRNAS